MYITNVTVPCSDFYSGGSSAPLLVTGSQYFSPTDDVMLFGHVPRPTPPTWAPAYAAAAAAAAAATYYRYTTASLPSPCSPFGPQFPPTGYLGVNDPLTSVGGYCGSMGVRAGEVGRCLKTLRCDLNNLPVHSTPPTSWQRSRGNYLRRLYSVSQKIPPEVF